MSTKDDISISLEPETFYHIFNRGNDGALIFYHQKNYVYFLKKYDAYMSNYVDTYAYCLLPNHFHLLVRVKKWNDIFQAAIADFKHTSDIPPHILVSEKHRRFFLAYAKAINKQEDRKGSLFQKTFRRKKVSDDDYFTNLIWYIHHNPIHHQVCDKLDYPWSSYPRLLLETESKLKKVELFDWFGSKRQFVDFHKQNIDVNKIEHLLME